MNPICFSQYVAQTTKEAGIEPTYDGTTATYQVTLGNVTFRVVIDQVDAQKRPLVISDAIHAPYAWTNVHAFNRELVGQLHASVDRMGNSANVIWKAPHAEKTQAEWQESFAKFVVLVGKARDFLSGKCVI